VNTTSNRYRKVSLETIIEGLQERSLTARDASIVRVRGINRSDSTGTRVMLKTASTSRFEIVQARGQSTREFTRIPLFLNGGIQSLNADNKADLVMPQLLLWNSHNGECSFQAKLGFFRLVCSNGMAVGSVVESVKLRHIQGPKFETEFAEFFDRIAIMAGEGLQRVQQLTSRSVSDSELESVVDALSNSARVREDIRTQFLNPYRAADAGRNVWSLWNVANEVMAARARSVVAFERRNEQLLPTILNVLDSDSKRAA
jgi:hypothetical protein